MRLSRWLTLALLLAGTAWLCGSVIPGCAAGGPLRRDYARLPPKAAFELAFHGPVPADVSDLRATGEAWIGGTNVWLRFHASEGAVRRLLAGCDGGPCDRASLQSFRDLWGPALHRYDPSGRLGWDELYRARQLESFGWSTDYGGSTSVWVDHKQGTVYAFVVGI